MESWVRVFMTNPAAKTGFNNCEICINEMPPVYQVVPIKQRTRVSLFTGL